MLTFEQIKELIDLVTERRLQSVEIERAGFRLRIDGRAPRPAEAPRTSSHPVRPAVTGAAEPEAIAEALLPAPPKAGSADKEESGLPPDTHLLDSPIVGTFYAAPSPDAEPYIRVGDQIRKGQVLCIVEAMKLMNEIESDVDGTLLEIYPKNAQPVEYGEPLFAIKAS